MHENSDSDSSVDLSHNDRDYQFNKENEVNETSNSLENHSTDFNLSSRTNSDNVVYAICDGVYDGETHREENEMFNRVVLLSLLRDEAVSGDNFPRSSQTRDEISSNITRLYTKHISLYPNKYRWWQKGQVRYGGHIYNMTEELVLKTFIPVDHPIDDKACPICLENLLAEIISLNGCLHAYHKECFLDYALKTKKSKIICPLCNRVSFTGRGPSPPGKMSWNVKKDMTLLSNGTFITMIEIKYKMKSGTQFIRHPNPGRPYKGVSKKAFLPITSDYIMILKMLILAFLDGQTFKVEDSTEENFGNTVWNGIEHKTSIDGGIQRGGFPDNNYKTRVMDSLISKGILISNND